MTEPRSSTNQEKSEPVPPTPAHGASAPGGAGDAHQVPVPSETPADGTSEEALPVEGVRTTAIARDGLADGEPDNRTPPTSTF